MTSPREHRPCCWLALLTISLLLAGCASPVPTAGPALTATPPPTATPTLAPTPTALAMPVAVVSTPTPLPAGTATASPTAPVGRSWRRVTSPRLVDLQGAVAGVMAGGPGSIAWGRVDGMGPRIWTSTDGVDWEPAVFRDPLGTDVSTWRVGGVVDVTAGGPGYVAVGWYVPRDLEGPWAVALVWTSVDGRSWRQVSLGPAFADSQIAHVIRWRGELLAFGSGPWHGVGGAPAIGWTSTDGVRWTRFKPSCPSSVEVLELNDVTSWSGALLALGRRTFTTVEDPHASAPPRFTSLDGRTWSLSRLPYIAPGERLHPLPGGLYMTATLAGTSTSPAWMIRQPGVYRSTDGMTWTPLAVGKPLGDEIVATGETLWMVGTAAWRSTDGGRTWRTVPVKGAVPAGVTYWEMTTAAILADGTLVAAGVEGGPTLGSRTAVWVATP